MFVGCPDENIWDFNSYLVFTSIRKTPNSELSCVKLSGPPTGSELTIGRWAFVSPYRKAVVDVNQLHESLFSSRWQI
jgi:hypothetical protein